MREFFVERDIIMVLVLTTIIPTYVKLETDKVRMAGDKASRRFYILISSLFYIPTSTSSTLLFPKKGIRRCAKSLGILVKRNTRYFGRLLCYKNNSPILDQLALMLSSLAVLYLITAISVQEDKSTGLLFSSSCLLPSCSCLLLSWNDAWRPFRVE